MVIIIKLTTAVAAAVTAKPLSALPQAAARSAQIQCSIARRIAMVDLPFPTKHDAMSCLQDSMAEFHLATAVAAVALTAPDISSGNSGTSAKPSGNFAASFS